MSLRLKHRLAIQTSSSHSRICQVRLNSAKFVLIALHYTFIHTLDCSVCSWLIVAYCQYNMLGSTTQNNKMLITGECMGTEFSPLRCLSVDDHLRFSFQWNHFQSAMQEASNNGSKNHEYWVDTGSNFPQLTKKKCKENSKQNANIANWDTRMASFANIVYRTLIKSKLYKTSCISNSY